MEGRVALASSAADSMIPTHMMESGSETFLMALEERTCLMETYMKETKP